MKSSLYAALVDQRRSCHVCQGLVNPAAIDGATLDSFHIGPWTQLHGDLNAELMIVGQDWGDVAYFRTNRGLDDLRNPTMRTLQELLASIEIDAPMDRYCQRSRGVFLTNAILCLKSGGMQAPVQSAWFNNCGSRFLRRQVELVRPRAVVPLGGRAYRALCDAFQVAPQPLRRAVEGNAIELVPDTLMVPVYHCGNRVLNTHRSKQLQLVDWQRVRTALGDR
ncbi:MAG TPA: uracil-DNA glycosylase family protein [Burkholderiaceae bacterium]|nr:uracil-DNA glycosylase family protein [Burkholderiaceae bacterium]